MISKHFLSSRLLLVLSIALLLLVFRHRVALADDAKSKSGVQPQVIKLPTGPGSLDGLGASFEPNLNTGTASYPVKFDVPPGRSGFQPELTLSYDGGNASGPWGLGWKLNVASICRYTDQGLPSYVDSQDRFVYSSGEKLVALANGDYRFKNESTFMRFRRAENGGWQGWVTDGTRFLFGETDNSRELNQYGIFCWKLERQLDTHGNEIHYNYLRDSGYVYLSEIRYNLTERGSYSAILINYSPRTDVFIDRRSRAPVSIGLRATEIQMWSQGRFVRAYQFAYESPLTAAAKIATEGVGAVDHSLLTVVTQIGEDGVSSLPPTTFTYTHFDPTTYQVISMQNPPPLGLTNPDADLVDINADSLPDVVWTPPDGHRYYLNVGNGRWQATPIYPSLSPADRLSSPNARMADINGDGQVDFVIKAGTTAGAPFYYYARKAGQEWEASDRVDFNVTPSFNVDDPNLRMMDVNNDKRVDFMLTTNDSYYIWLAHADNTWSTTADFVTPTKAVGSPLIFSNPRFKLGDMTGDGLQDLVFVRDGLVIYFPSNGNGDFGEAVTMSNAPFNLGPLDVQLQLGDLNRDGLDDLILVGNRTVRYWLNLGNHRFSTPINLAGTPAYSQNNTAVRLADLDGDGATELLYSHYPAAPQEIMQYVDFSTSSQPYLLQSIDNGLGRTVHIDYKPSTAYYVADQDTNRPWTTTLPFPVQVVSRVTVHDANSGDDYTVDYTYRDGYYDGVLKEFRGFAHSQEIEHGDASAATTVTLYHYDTGVEQESRRGLLLDKAVLGEGGECTQNYTGCYQREVNQVNTRLLADEGAGHQVTYSFIAQTDTFLHEGQSTPVQLRQRFDYDAYGNRTQELNYGQVCNEDVTCGDDEVLKYTEYALNTDQWIVNLPSHIRQTDAAGNLVSEARLYYDGDAFVGLPLGQVTRGDLSRQEESLGSLGSGAIGARFIPTKRQQFDAYGNVTGILDANSNRTSVEFDEQSHTFPVLERIHLGDRRSLAYAATYHFGFGKVTGVVDFNGNTYLFVYDAFGRITKLVKPGDTVVLPTQAFSYNLGSPRSSISTALRQQSGTTNVLTSTVYFDGLGRKLQTRRQAENNQVVVEGAMNFNIRQSERDSWLPYFATDFAYAAPDPASPHTSKRYDPLGRLLQATNPDGSFSSVSYQPLTQVQFDEEDNRPASPSFNTPKTLFYDGLERLVGVEEVNIVNGATERYTTRYAYDRLGNLTQITDALGNIKTMQYDALSRKLFMDDPDHGVMQYSYDDNGNLIQTTDAKGQVIRTSYDAANRKQVEQWSQPDGSFKTAFTWHYDADLSPFHADAGNTLGQVTYIEDSEGATFFSYDARGNVAGRLRRFAAEGWSFVTRRAYDAQDRLTQLTYPDGFTVNYAYNTQGLLEHISGFVENVDYNAANRRTTIAYTNGAVTGYHYDLRQRLDQMRTTASQRLLQDLAYQFDGVSNIIAITDNRPDRTAANDQNQRFQYDALYRLTQSTGTYGQIDHAYNAIGNMIRQNATGSAGSPIDARLNLNEMKYGENGTGPHALTTAGGQSYTYDANGNRLGKGSAAYIWNPRDWLLSVSDGNALSIYSYDATGQRVRQTVQQGGVITTTLYADAVAEVRGNQLLRYVFDDQKRIAEMAVAFEPSRLLKGFSGSGAETNIPPAITRWYITDHLGGTSLLVDQAAQVVSEVVYYPFGLTRYEMNGGVAKYRFTGKELDQSGLYYFEARYYDPIIDKFISTDPLLSEESTRGMMVPQELNLYVYAMNSPIKMRDLTGLEAEQSDMCSGSCTMEPVVVTGQPQGPSGNEMPSQNQFGEPAGRIPVAERIAPDSADLVRMNKYGEAPTRGQRIFELQRDAAQAFRTLRTAAGEAGFNKELFTLTSAYRDQSRQDSLAKNADSKHGAEARTWTAKRSEHLTGRAIDLNLGIGNSSENALSGAFNSLPAFQWLQKNASSFGLNPYPVEPWHWSYNVRK